MCVCVCVCVCVYVRERGGREREEEREREREGGREKGKREGGRRRETLCRYTCLSVVHTFVCVYNGSQRTISGVISQVLSTF